MRARHSGERALLARKQAERGARKNQERADRLHSGLRGLWENITGRARTLKAINEAEAIDALARDRAQRDSLIWAQLRERGPLQAQLENLRIRHRQEWRQLAQEIVRQMRQRLAAPERAPRLSRPRWRDPRSLER